MSRKTCAFALMVLTLVLTLVPSVYAEYPIDDLVVVQDLPENMVAGSTYVMVILFDNIAKEPVTFYVNITVTSDEPLSFGEILVDEVKLNEDVLPCEETEPGNFSTPAGGILDEMSRNRLDITISTVANLMPGAYIFEIDLMGLKMEPEPGPPHIIGRPNAKPKADAGPNQKAWVGSTVYFDGSKSEDPDGTIESYEWDFGDGEGASGVAVEHEYSEPGQYTVTLTVRDDRWAYDSDTCKIKVSETPTTVSAEFAERVPGKKKGHVVDASDVANTTVTLNTTEPVTVTILVYDDNPHPEDPIPAKALPIYVDVEVSNSTAVEWPIYVEMFYTDEEVEGLDEYSLGIYYWFNGTWQRCSNTGVDTVRNVVWAYMTEEEASGSPILMGGMHAIIPPPLPPYLDNLNVTPAVIELGDNVTISVDIRNMDSQSITYAVDMHIENVSDPPPTWPPMDIYLRIWVELEAYESKTVSHNQTMNTVGDFNVTIIGMTGSFTVKAPPPLPAKFGVSDLFVSPDEVEEGETVTVSVDVTNVGETEGSYTLELVLDGVVVESEEITSLEGGMTVTVVFELTRSEGTYQVEFDGLTGSFTVKAPPKPAEFEFSNLEVDPDRVAEGEEVTITVKIDNIGEQEGTHTVLLEVDGLVTELAEITLDGGESTTVTFTITETPGDHTIRIEDLTGIFTVTAPPFWMRPGYVAGILILIIAAAAIIFIRRPWSSWTKLEAGK